MKVFLLMLLFWPLSLRESELFEREIIVWNIGQGQWVTVKEKEVCKHFDMGGDRNQTIRVLQECSHRENKIFLSHADLDHMNYIKGFSQRVRNICLESLPPAIPSKEKEKVLKSVTLCTHPSQEVKKIYSGARVRNVKSLNQSSRVYQDRSANLLSPGDSPSAQENIWQHQVMDCPQWLILGHHGSRTSSSTRLLKRLKCLKGAIASARWMKYGHPHNEVIARLHSLNIPLLKTEDWGTIRIRY